MNTIQNSSTTSLKSKVSQKLAVIILAAWLSISTLILGVLSLNHGIALPSPEQDKLSQIARSLYKLSPLADRLVIHILASDCSCTTSLTRHLLKNGANGTELILYVGDDTELKIDAEKAGYDFISVNNQQLTDLGLESAPVLALFSQSGELNYLGGYYDHPSASRPLDFQLRADWRAGKFPAPLPIFGCATSARLKSAFDPLGLDFSS